MAEEEDELSAQNIGQSVSTLSRQEMDDAVEPITGKVRQGELMPLLPPGQVIQVISQGEIKVECTECSASVMDLNTHMKSHQEKKYACNDCPKKYRANCDLKTHMKSVHLKVLDTCPHCGRQTANLKKHIYMNHTNEFPCNLCGRHFARQTQLNYHMKAHERGTILEKAGPDVQKEMKRVANQKYLEKAGSDDQKERKRVANQKYLEKRKVRKEMDADLHEHEKNLKRIWARKNKDKLMKYKKEYYEKKRTMKSNLEEKLILDVETLTQ